MLCCKICLECSEIAFDTDHYIPQSDKAHAPCGVSVNEMFDGEALPAMEFEWLLSSSYSIAREYMFVSFVLSRVPSWRSLWCLALCRLDPPPPFFPAGFRRLAAAPELCLFSSA